MRRRKFGSALAAVAIATAAAIPILAAPAGAATACGAPGGIFPATPGAQSGLKIDCTTVAGAPGLVDNIAVADALNGYWHHGAARTVAVTPTASSNTITFAGTDITAADIARPISGGCIGGSAFIRTVGAGTATLSVNNGATCAATTATIEYTRNRVLVDANCTIGATSNLTSPTALFTAADVNKTVSGGPFTQKSKITAVVNPTTATVTPHATAVCTDGNPAVIGVQDTITIGAATINGAGAVIWDTDPNTKQLQNSAAPPAGGGQAFTCTGSVLTPTAAAKTAGGGVTAAYVGLKVVVTAGPNTVTTKVNSATATALTLAAPCPAGVTATVGLAVIGEPGANAPHPGSAMASLSAELNLNPTLVSTQDDCNKNTFEGFQVIGQWNNPGGYGAGLGAPTIVSVGQISYPTAVISFSAYIRPQPTGDALLAGAHYEYVFPALPTSLAVCLTGANPTNPTALAFGINPTVLSTAPALPTGSGNPGDPAVRAIGPQTGAFAGKYQLRLGTTVKATGALPSCTIAAPTAAPTFACGDA